jgi:hypothetical protein
MRSQQDRTERILEELFRKRLTGRKPRADFPGIDPQTVRVRNLRVENRELICEADLDLTYEPTASRTYAVRLPIELEIRILPSTVSTRMTDGSYWMMLYPVVSADRSRYPMYTPGVVMPPLPLIREIEAQLNDIAVPPTQHEEIRSFIEGYEGFPHGVPQTFGRMLYLSAITITTVGYGDVVPLTGTARTLVALEATLGIVLLGLFIGSLSSRKQQPSVQRETAEAAPSTAHPLPDQPPGPIRRRPPRPSVGPKLAVGTLLIAAAVILGKRRR